MFYMQIAGERKRKVSADLCQQKNFWCRSEGRRPEESGVKAFQKQDQILPDAQNDRQNQVLYSVQDDRAVSF